MSDDASPPQLAQKHSATLAFEKGSLTVKLQGHGDQVGAAELTVDDSDLDYPPQPESRATFRTLVISPDDVVAISKFLARYLTALRSVATDPAQDGA